MHMRGHGDEYKTAAALARPDKHVAEAQARPKRFVRQSIVSAWKLLGLVLFYVGRGRPAQL